METSKMQFMLTGFSELMGFRVFKFEGVAADRSRSAYAVKADMALVRRYGIRLQELPLLCKAVLERWDQSGDKRAFTYTEEDMSQYARATATRADATKRNPPRRPVNPSGVTPWRSTPV